MTRKAAADKASGVLSRTAIETAVRRIEGRDVTISFVGPIAGDRAETELKQIGYGEPVLVRYLVDGSEKKCVVHTMSPNWFGHDRRSDRAALALLAADTFNQVPHHVRALDVGALDGCGEFVSLRGTGELYVITSYAEGTLYAHDLRRIEQEGRATEMDVARAKALATYLVRLHMMPFSGPKELYIRAIRDLIGSGEGIFGIVDSYPMDGPVPASRLASLEARAVAWRFKLRGREDRLRKTHGDFHPYNMLFREGTEFTLLDASRGGKGEPADDLAALTINYIFGSVVYPGSWKEGLEPLWDAFWTTYLNGTCDKGVLEVIAPFFAWRALVVASPVWYPSLSADERDRLLSFAEVALDAESFDPFDVGRFVA